MFKTYDDVLSFNQANVDALVQSGTKLATGIEEVTKEYFGFAGKTFEQAMDNAKALTACKTATDVIQMQQKFAKDAWESAVAETNRMTEMGTVITKSVLEPIQARYKATFEAFNVKVA